MKKKNWLNGKISYLCDKIKDMSNYLNALLEHATSQGYKSNVIKPLVGMMIVFVIGTIASHYFGVPYMPTILCILSTLCGIGLLFAYFFCLIKSPDLLRSERYNLEKTAIEKVALIGDSTTKTSITFPHSDYVVVDSSQIGQIEQIQAEDER